MGTVILVAMGSAIGGMARYGMSVWIGRLGRGSFPWPTLAVNVLGSVAIGALLGWMGAPLSIEAPERISFATFGLLGGFTTFSTLSLEVFDLLERGEQRSVFAYIAATLVLGISGAVVGYLLTGS